MPTTHTHAEADAIAKEKVAALAAACGTRAAAAKHLGVNKGLISYVLDGGHSPTVLLALDMEVPDRIEVEACVACGKLHKMAKGCHAGSKPGKPRYRQIAELHSSEELEALDDLAEHNGFKNWSVMCRWLAREAILGNKIWIGV